MSSAWVWEHVQVDNIAVTSCHAWHHPEVTNKDDKEERAACPELYGSSYKAKVNFSKENATSSPCSALTCWSGHVPGGALCP